ncbi:hypothetical protein KS4_18360 [Poriferisphaera corsica]|uniref:Uncharacterized protein n=1 Tax=Poriferisphaera corsica TaxID=2528020 RepID=A0A517YU84_9BACT|nr:hypothetical protein [Poriferisphaera corsica]QDU33779.1 hypothetical protein KS4_18360 [Poriferisphaera corsica]
MTHEELVEACRRIALDHGCLEPILDPRRRNGNGEHPDAFAVYEKYHECAYQVDSGPSITTYPGMSLCLECKATLADLRKDREKPWRSQEYAVGDVRLYVAEEGGEIESRHIKDEWGWGLVLVRPDGSHYLAVHPRLMKHARQIEMQILGLWAHQTMIAGREANAGTSSHKSERRRNTQQQSEREAILHHLQEYGDATAKELNKAIGFGIKSTRYKAIHDHLEKLGIKPVPNTSPTLYAYGDQKT